MSERLRNALYLLAALVLLAGLWLILKPSSPVAGPTGEAEPVVTAANAADFVWEVREGFVTGPQLLVVRQGEQVRLQVTSDQDDELHLHGYEVARKLQAGEAATITLALTQSGRFELELHRVHRTLAVLEVEPD